MSISRKMIVAELKLTHAHLGQWIDELENPGAAGPGGQIIPADVSADASVIDMETIPREQLKAELAMMAGKLEVIATTV